MQVEAQMLFHNNFQAITSSPKEQTWTTILRLIESSCPLNIMPPRITNLDPTEIAKPDKLASIIHRVRVKRLYISYLPNWRNLGWICILYIPLNLTDRVIWKTVILKIPFSTTLSAISTRTSHSSLLWVIPTSNSTHTRPICSFSTTMSCPSNSTASHQSQALQADLQLQITRSQWHSNSQYNICIHRQWQRAV